MRGNEGEGGAEGGEGVTGWVCVESVKVLVVSFHLDHASGFTSRPENKN